MALSCDGQKELLLSRVLDRNARAVRHGVLIGIPDTKLRSNPRALDAKLALELTRDVLQEIVGVQEHADAVPSDHTRR